MDPPKVCEVTCVTVVTTVCGVVGDIVLVANVVLVLWNVLVAVTVEEITDWVVVVDG